MQVVLGCSIYWRSWQLCLASILKNCLNQESFDYLLFLCIARMLYRNLFWNLKFKWKIGLMHRIYIAGSRVIEKVLSNLQGYVPWALQVIPSNNNVLIRKLRWPGETAFLEIEIQLNRIGAGVWAAYRIIFCVSLGRKIVISQTEAPTYTSDRWSYTSIQLIRILSSTL